MVQARPDGAAAPAGAQGPRATDGSQSTLPSIAAVPAPAGPPQQETGPRSGPLDRLEAISDPRATGCPRWPEHLRLFAEQTGELIEGRCKATNLCRYCQARYVAETVEALLLDASYGPGPELYVVLTAREHLTRPDTYDHLKQVRKACRLRWPDLEWFVQVEFQLRGALHLNLLVKGVPVADADKFYELVCRVWCGRVDALPAGQWIGEVVGEFGSLAKYLGKRLGHGLKAEQAPPIGWRGHRTSQTRGYFNRPVTELRVEARRAFRHRALTRRMIEAGHSPHDVELLVRELVELADATTWRIRWLPAPKQPLAERERERPARVPFPVLEAAWRYLDLEAARQAAQDAESASATAEWRVVRRSEGLRAPPPT